MRLRTTSSSDHEPADRVSPDSASFPLKSSHTLRNSAKVSNPKSLADHSVLQCLQCWSYWVKKKKEKKKKLCTCWEKIKYCFDFFYVLRCFWNTITVFVMPVEGFLSLLFFCIFGNCTKQQDIFWNPVPFWTSLFFLFTFSEMLFVRRSYYGYKTRQVWTLKEDFCAGEPNGLKMVHKLFPDQARHVFFCSSPHGWLKVLWWHLPIVIWRHTVYISSYFTTFTHSLYKTKQTNNKKKKR